MLVLSRKQGERIVIEHAGERIVLRVGKVGGGAVRLGLEAGANVRILRGELFDRAQRKRSWGGRLKTSRSSRLKRRRGKGRDAMREAEKQSYRTVFPAPAKYTHCRNKKCRAKLFAEVSKQRGWCQYCFHHVPPSKR